MSVALNPATTRRPVRWAGALGVLGGTLQALGGILETVDRVRPGEPGFAVRTSIIGIAYLMLLAAVIGIGRSGAAGIGRPARLGLIAAGLGWVVSAVAQFVLQVEPDPAEKVLFPVATVLVGVGMIMAGVGVLRARRWQGWHRVTPLICGLYPFVLIFPVIAATGGPNFLAFAGWGVCWLALGASLWRES